MSKVTDCLLVSVSFTDENTGTLVVGKALGKSQAPYILNAFSGEEAHRLYEKLTIQNNPKLASQKVIEREVALLVDRYGKEAILNALSAMNNH